jgi:hypothetical protein
MSAPERINVLLSRARNALILIGNAHTFQHARRGGESWAKLFVLLKNRGHIYDGLPVRCEQHPGITADLCTPEDFDLKVPDGGCTQPWSVVTILSFMLLVVNSVQRIAAELF